MVRISGGTRWPVRLAGAAAAAGAAGIGGWILYSRVAVEHRVPLPPAVDAERLSIASEEAGFVSCYADRRGEGRPLLLLHSVNAAASAFEMRPLFDRFRGERPVLAPDLPGFGLSQRAARTYSPELYEAAVRDVLRELAPDGADVVASSLTCEFAARAALAEPGLVHSLALLSPTGLGCRSRTRGGSDGTLGALTHPAWSQAFYDLVVSRPSIRHFLRKSFVGEVPAALADYAWRSAHQPGARHAPLHFLAGHLFTPWVRDSVYDRLEQPVLVVYDEDAYTDFEGLEELAEARANWRAERIRPTRGMPHWERPVQTVDALLSFWGSMS